MATTDATVDAAATGVHLLLQGGVIKNFFRWWLRGGWGKFFYC